MLAAVFGLSSCDKKSSTTSTSGTMTMVCDESFRNVLEQEIDVYEYVYPQSHILCRYLPQSEVLDSLLEFKTATAVISRELTEAEMKHLKKRKTIGTADADCCRRSGPDCKPQQPHKPAYHQRGGFSPGRRDSLWNELWPADASAKSTCTSTTAAPAPYNICRTRYSTAANSEPEFTPKAAYPKCSAPLKTTKTPRHSGSKLAHHRHGTRRPARLGPQGYDSRPGCPGQSDDQIEAPQFNTAIKVLNIRRDDEMDAYKPYQQYIYDGRYPFTRKIYMCTTAVGGSLGGGFYSYVTGWDGQKIISLTGIMPARIKARIVELN